MKVTVTVQPSHLILGKLGLSHNGRVHQLLDREVERRSRIYVPKRKGFLEASGRPSSPRVGFVTWDRPYARYQYYGRVMVGGKRKVLTNRSLKSHGGGLRGARWFERMKKDSMSEILTTLANAVGGQET